MGHNLKFLHQKAFFFFFSKSWFFENLIESDKIKEENDFPDSPVVKPSYYNSGGELEDSWLGS